jgi:hypothetical protein
VAEGGNPKDGADDSQHGQGVLPARSDDSQEGHARLLLVAEGRDSTGDTHEMGQMVRTPCAGLSDQPRETISSNQPRETISNNQRRKMSGAIATSNASAEKPTQVAA